MARRGMGYDSLQGKLSYEKNNISITLCKCYWARHGTPQTVDSGPYTDCQSATTQKGKSCGASSLPGTISAA